MTPNSKHVFFSFGFCKSLELKVNRLEKEKEKLQDKGSTNGEREEGLTRNHCSKGRVGKEIEFPTDSYEGRLNKVKK